MLVACLDQLYSNNLATNPYMSLSRTVYPSCVSCALSAYQPFRVPNSPWQALSAQQLITFINTGDTHELAIFFSTRTTGAPLPHSCLRLTKRVTQRKACPTGRFSAGTGCICT